MLWAGDKCLSCLQHAGPFLSDEEARTVRVTGNLWLTTYVSLPNEAQANAQLLFECRPKLHLMNDAVDEAWMRPSKRNPSADTTWMDEDFVKVVMAMERRMSFKNSSLNCLLRLLVVTKQSLSKLMST